MSEGFDHLFFLIHLFTSNKMFHNLTIFRPTNACFEWCKQQNFINENNIQIEELSLVAIALIGLVINKLILDHGDWLVEKTRFTEYPMSEEKLLKLANAGTFMAFTFLILFLGYYLWFK